MTSPVSDVPPIVSWVVVALTVMDAMAVPDDATQRGAAPHVIPKLTTHDVRIPVPAVTVPKLSPPDMLGLTPQLDTEGAVLVASTCPPKIIFDVPVGFFIKTTLPAGLNSVKSFGLPAKPASVTPNDEL
jgi:hypothetical protein